MMRRRVVATGLGCITPLGTETEAVWPRLVEGHSGIGPISLFDASDFPIRIAGEVRDWDLSDIGEDPADWIGCPRQTLFAVGSAVKAARSAGLGEADIEPRRMGVYFGCGETFYEFAEMVGMAAVGNTATVGGTGGPQTVSWDHDYGREQNLNEPAQLAAALLRAEGPNFNCTAACVSSSQAIGESVEIIRRGDADVMLAGGAHSMLHPLGVTGLYQLSVLTNGCGDPTKAMRPFDRDRDGFVIGEGGGVVVLESLEHALARGAEIWGEVTGYGSAHDAYRITDLHPEAQGIKLGISRALEDARLDAEDIDYINAHGTSTVLNDKVETLAIKQYFGVHARRLPVSSTKSMVGHLTTACGAIETIVSLMALKDGVVPPTINYEHPDPDCDLDYVPNSARQIPCRHVLSNSFGFGGQCAALVLSRYEEAGRAAVSVPDWQRPAQPR